MSLVVLCPSRNNPTALIEAATSFAATVTGPSTFFIGVVDYDDPKLAEYITRSTAAGILLMQVPEGEAGSMNAAMNWAAASWAQEADVVGFIGDDHRFRTKGWDRAIEMVLDGQGGGFAYADDLGQRENLPTQVFISAKIVRALGWMGLPGARHLYLDDTWKRLGDGAGCLYYIPDIVIEHMHPAFGKGAWDENHVRVNSQEMYSHDAKIYADWVEHRSTEDIEIVRSAVG